MAIVKYASQEQRLMTRWSTAWDSSLRFVSTANFCKQFMLRGFAWSSPDLCSSWQSWSKPWALSQLLLVTVTMHLTGNLLWMRHTPFQVIMLSAIPSAACHRSVTADWSAKVYCVRLALMVSIRLQLPRQRRLPHNIYTAVSVIGRMSEFWINPSDNWFTWRVCIGVSRLATGSGSECASSNDNKLAGRHHSDWCRIAYVTVSSSHAEKHDQYESESWYTSSRDAS